MPRLTNHEYIRRHQQLRQRWLDDERSFARLGWHAQRILLDYYIPYKQLSDEDLLQHRAAITAKSPGLAASAGRAYQQFVKGAAVPVTVHHYQDGHGHPHRLSVRGVAAPIDHDEFMQAFVRILVDTAAQSKFGTTVVSRRQGTRGLVSSQVALYRGARQENQVTIQWLLTVGVIHASFPVFQTTLSAVRARLRRRGYRQ